MNERHTERRQYFRIDDDIHLDYRVLDEAAYHGRMESPGHGGESGDVLLQLHNLTIQTGNIMAAIRKRDPEIGQYLAILDKKVELLRRALSNNPADSGSAASIRVTLGAGGIDFPAAEPLATGTLLELHLELLPGHLPIHCLGKVMHCAPATSKTDKPYRVGVDFTHISEMARDAIVRHTLELQSAQLRRARELPPQ